MRKFIVNIPLNITIAAASEDEAQSKFEWVDIKITDKNGKELDWSFGDTETITEV